MSLKTVIQTYNPINENYLRVLPTFTPQFNADLSDVLHISSKAFCRDSIDTMFHEGHIDILFIFYRRLFLTLYTIKCSKFH